MKSNAVFPIEGGIRKMNIFTSRKAVIVLIFASLALPLFAHHAAQFLSKTMEANAAEVQLAEMALTNSQNTQVKEYAQMLMRDHKEALNTINELRDMRTANSLSSNQNANPKNTSAADVKLSPEHQRISQKLASLKGADFDREYIAVMVESHRQAIREFETQSHAHGSTAATTPKGSAGQDANAHEKPSWEPRQYTKEELSRDLDTAEFAQASLPTLRHHLDMAMQIQKGLQPATPKTPTKTPTQTK